MVWVEVLLVFPGDEIQIFVCRYEKLAILFELRQLVVVQHHPVIGAYRTEPPDISHVWEHPVTMMSPPKPTVEMVRVRLTGPMRITSIWISLLQPRKEGTDYNALSSGFGEFDQLPQSGHFLLREIPPLSSLKVVVIQSGIRIPIELRDMNFERFKYSLYEVVFAFVYRDTDSDNLS